VPPGDVIATFADTSRAERELGWKPAVMLADGIEGVVRWLRENPEVPRPQGL